MCCDAENTEKENVVLPCYNFDLVPDRRGTDSYKWDGMKKEFPKRPDAIPLWVADTDFPCPRSVSDAILKRAAHPIYGYCSESKETAEAVADWQKKRNHWQVDPSWITYSNGVVTALSMAVRAFAKEGEGVMFMSPVYYPFRKVIAANHRKIRASHMKFDGIRWVIDFENLERLAAMPDTKLLLLCNPHNPVCRVFEQKELERIAEICLKNHVWIMSDEIHSDLIFSGSRHIPIASLNESVADITMTAVAPSKSFNIAGLQMSAVITKSQSLREQLTAALGFDFIPNIFGLTAFTAAYRNEDITVYLEELIAYIYQNYQLLDQKLKKDAPKIRVQKPEGTYLMWLDCRELGLDEEKLYSFFVEEAGLGIEPGHLFGIEIQGFVRMNLGCTRATVKECCSRIITVYHKHGF